MEAHRHSTGEACEKALAPHARTLSCPRPPEAKAEPSVPLLAPAEHEHDARHPASAKPPASSSAHALPKDQGSRTPTPYRHTTRPTPLVPPYDELLAGRPTVRDHALSFTPASPEHTMAADIGHRPPIAHLATAFGRLWQSAAPPRPEAAQRLSSDGVPPRRRAVAALRVEGRTDTVIADRPGTNIRTTREHTTKPAAPPGSAGVARLGCSTGESGILEQREIDT